MTSHIELFRQLDSYLYENQHYWRYQPFQIITNSQAKDWPWAERDSALCQHLEQISAAQTEELRQDSFHLIDWLSPHIPDLVDRLAGAVFPDTLSINEDEICREPSLYNGIPGRKVDQLNAMANFAIRRHRGKRWLEWCAGKGYLGRILAARTGQDVVSFEYQADLCQAGQAIADQKLLPITFVQGDAFLAKGRTVVCSDMHAMALHACGDLHVRLIEYACEEKLPAITIAPCCYHLTQDELYQPLSSTYQQSLLQFTQDDLRIPLQETVTGGQRVRRHRQLEMTYRSGLDLILKQELKQSNYLPIPSIKKSMLANGFPAFCLWAAKQKGYQLESINFDHYLAMAEVKYIYMEKLALVQQAFFPLIEAWIILDKAIYLEEQGYRVSVHHFCAKSVTPRNILIHAELPEK